jgi:L-rhamnose mutarotase
MYKHLILDLLQECSLNNYAIYINSATASQINQKTFYSNLQKHKNHNYLKKKHKQKMIMSCTKVSSNDDTAVWKQVY